MINPFFIATTQRSGGFFLMSLLNSTRKVGYVHEYLYQFNGGWKGEVTPTDEDIQSGFREFYKMASGNSDSKFWGSKVDVRELWVAERWLHLNNINPKSIKWIWLSRKNKFRQSLSYNKAITTGIWHLCKTDPEDKVDLARAEIEVDRMGLCEKALRFYVANDAWSQFFQIHDIRPHVLYYEDFIDELTWETIVADIFDYIGVNYELPLEISTTRLKQGISDPPESYLNIIERMAAHGIPLKYTNLITDKYHELDLEGLL